MNAITESGNPERDAAIFEAHRGGAAINEIAKQYRISVARARQLIKRSDATEVFDLVIEDGMNRVPIALITTSRGFIYACRMAKRKYPGLFARLELPSWRLRAGDHSIPLNSEELTA